MSAGSGIKIGHLPDDFTDWDALLALISSAFAYMDGVVDPPSSAQRLTPRLLPRNRDTDLLLAASEGSRFVGCIFVHERSDHVYVGKLAVAPSHQRRSIGAALLQAAEDHARLLGKPTLELQTRVELTGNQAAFARMGFHETERTAHAGYDRPTSLTMRKQL